LEDAPPWIVGETLESSAVERELRSDIFVADKRGVGRGEHRGEAFR
jgi:hypothetical protein